MKNEFDLFVLPDGTLKFIYDDKLEGITHIGDTEVKRASHVDPVKEDGKIRWYADLAPCGGPKLGPFLTREKAIEAEIKWIHKHISEI